MTTLGYGVTVWARGEGSGHLDGIGVYTKALYSALERLPVAHCLPMKPFVFGRDKPLLPCGQPESVVSRVSLHLLAATCGYRARCPVALFHATDHHIPRLRGVPVVATVMDLIPFLHPEWVTTSLRPLKNWLFKRSILSADHLITISEYSRQDLMRHFNVPRDKISVTPLGVDEAYFTPVDLLTRQAVLARYALPADFFLFIGTLQPRKNLAALLAAHALLPLAAQKRHPLVIVGRYGWGVEELLPRLQALKALGTLYWLDYVPRQDVFALLQSARALTFMSLYEGFGLPILEAFASGCAVIASNTTSIPEVAGDAALLVDPTNPSAIAEAMQQVLRDEQLVASLRAKGRARAPLFTWDACARATRAVYEQLLTGCI